MIPAWLLDIFAALMLMVVALSATRLAVARPWRQGMRRAALADVDVAHLLMALAMAGMLTASLKTLPDGVWAVIFGVLAAWFAFRVVRDARVSGVRALAGGHCAPHLIHASAMLYMVLALAGPAGGSGMGGMSGVGSLELPALAFVFALLLIGYSTWDLDQLSGPGPSGHYSLATARVAMLAGATAGAAAQPGAAAPGLGAAASGLGAAAPGLGTAAPGLGAAPGTGDEGMAAASRVPPADVGVQGGGTGVLAPWVTIGCRITMGVTMAFMLLIMI